MMFVEIQGRARVSRLLSMAFGQVSMILALKVIAANAFKRRVVVMLRVVVALSVLTVLASFSTSVFAQDEKTVKEEIERLQGVWKPISAENEGKQLDPKEDDWTLKFTGEKVVQLRKGTVHVEGKVEIASPTKTSKRAYWKHTNVDVKNSVIYFFVGPDTLVTCWNGKDDGSIMEWPTGFATGSPGTGAYLVVWKREK
jgi:uncharacterized protein (TIGR03067 family)